MEFSINNHQFEVTANSCDCVIRTDKGVFVHNNTLGHKPQDCDMPTMFFTAMAGTYEGEAFPGYREWLNYICERDCPRNRQIHARYVRQAKQWHQISDVNADEVLNYLSDNFDI